MFVVAVCVAVVGGTLACFPNLRWSTLGVAEDVLSAAREKLQPAFPFLRAAQPLPAVRSVEPFTDVEGYAVVVAWKRHWAQQDPVILRREIRPDPHVGKGEVPDATWLPAELRFRYRPAINDLASKWNQTRLLEERFENPAEFLVRPESSLPVNDGRKGIPANASGYFAVSAVGFDHTRRHAAIYVMHREGRYGDGTIFLLSKDANGAWHVEKSVMVWIT